MAGRHRQPCNSANEDGDVAARLSRGCQAENLAGRTGPPLDPPVQVPTGDIAMVAPRSCSEVPSRYLRRYARGRFPTAFVGARFVAIVLPDRRAQIFAANAYGRAAPLHSTAVAVSQRSCATTLAGTAIGSCATARVPAANGNRSTALPMAGHTARHYPEPFTETVDGGDAWPMSTHSKTHNHEYPERITADERSEMNEGRVGWYVALEGNQQ